MFLPDFLESDGKFADKFRKINMPSSVSIEAETPCLCSISLNRAADSRASREKSTNPTGSQHKPRDRLATGAPRPESENHARTPRTRHSSGLENHRQNA